MSGAERIAAERRPHLWAWACRCDASYDYIADGADTLRRISPPGDAEKCGLCGEVPVPTLFEPAPPIVERP